MNSPLNPGQFRLQKQMAEPGSGYLQALRVTFYYLIFCALWILLSDRFLASFVSDPEMFTKLQTDKGECFVVTSAFLIYILLKIEKRRHDFIEQSRRQSEQQYRQLSELPSDGIFIIGGAEICAMALDDGRLQGIVGDIPFCHHEWFNGDGYPRGLSREEIPLPARIFAVVDVWDAFRSDRTYRSAWSVSEVRKYLKDQSGIQFDPDVVERFLEIVPDEEELKG